MADRFQIDDDVIISLDLDIVQDFQTEEHGGWDEEMKNIIGKPGKVVSNFETDYIVKFGQFSFRLNPDILTPYFAENRRDSPPPVKEKQPIITPPPAVVTRFNQTVIEQGNLVRLLNNKEQVKSLQQGHGEWVDAMEHFLGKCGLILNKINNACYRVKFARHKLTVNAKCLQSLTQQELQQLRNDNAHKKEFHEHDFVEVITNCDEFRRYQKEADEIWDPQMNAILGKIGYVKSSGSQVIVLKINNSFWSLSKNCVRLLVTNKLTEINGIHIGDKVRVINDVQKLKSLQANHGGYVDAMRLCLGQAGVVKEILNNSQMRVMVGGMSWVFNPEALTLCNPSMSSATGAVGNGSSFSAFDPTDINVGDYVRVDNNELRLQEMQVGHGDTELLDVIKGKVGKVTAIEPGGDYVVEIQNNKWTLNPKVIVKEQGYTEPDTVERQLLEDFSGLLSGEMPKIPPEFKLGSSLHNMGLVSAIVNGDVSMARFAIMAGADINDDSSGYYPIHLACVQGYGNITKLLLDHGARVDILDNDGNCPIHLCAHKGDTESLRHILDKFPATVDVVNDRLSTALHIAVGKGHYVFMRHLVEKYNANLSLKDISGDTPLHDAITHHRDDIVKYLIEKGASMETENERGFDAFQFSALRGHSEALKIILEKYPQKVNSRKDDGFAALHITAFNNHIEATQLLLLIGNADPNVTNSHGHTPLHLAIAKEHLQIVELLLNSEATDVNFPDFEKDTPLHDALKRASVYYMKKQAGALLTDMSQLLPDVEGFEGSSDTIREISKLLVKRGANITAKNAADKTPIQLCLDRQLTGELIQLARQYHRANPDTSFQEPCNQTMSASDQTEVLGHLRSVTYGIPETNQMVPSTSNARRTQNRHIDSRKSCKNCNQKEKTVALVNCGHVFCDDCARQPNCPACNQPVKDRITLYM